MKRYHRKFPLGSLVEISPGFWWDDSSDEVSYGLVVDHDRNFLHVLVGCRIRKFNKTELTNLKSLQRPYVKFWAQDVLRPERARATHK